jgi:hypothetical protein
MGYELLPERGFPKLYATARKSASYTVRLEKTPGFSK